MNDLLTVSGVAIFLWIVGIIITIMIICAIFSIARNTFEMRNILVNIEKRQDEEIELLEEIAGYNTTETQKVQVYKRTE